MSADRFALFWVIGSVAGYIIFSLCLFLLENFNYIRNKIRERFFSDTVHAASDDCAQDIAHQLTEFLACRMCEELRRLDGEGKAGTKCPGYIPRETVRVHFKKEPLNTEPRGSAGKTASVPLPVCGSAAFPPAGSTPAGSIKNKEDI